MQVVPTGALLVHHPSLTLSLADHTVFSHAAAPSRPPAGAIPVSPLTSLRSVRRTLTDTGHAELRTPHRESPGSQPIIGVFSFAAGNLYAGRAFVPLPE